MLKKEDFKFFMKGSHSQFDDWYFRVEGESKTELESRHGHYADPKVDAVMYCATNDTVYVRVVYPTEPQTVTPNDDELKDILKQLVDEEKNN